MQKTLEDDGLCCHLSAGRTNLRTKTNILMCTKSCANSSDHCGLWSKGALKSCKYTEIYDRLLFLMVYQHLGNITDISKESLIESVCSVYTDLFICWYKTTKDESLEAFQGIWMIRPHTPKAALYLSAQTFLKTVRSLARHKRLKIVPLNSLFSCLFKQ